MNVVEPITISQLGEASQADLTDQTLAIVSVPDSSTPSGYASKKSLLSRLKEFFLGSTSISGIGDGTVTGAISSLNSDLAKSGTRMTQSLSAAVSVPSGTTTNLVSVELPAGTWIILGSINYQGSSSATGYRIAYLGTGETTSNLGAVELPPVASVNTRLQITAIARYTAQTRIYLNALQNSGSAITVNANTTYITAVRIA